MISVFSSSHTGAFSPAELGKCLVAACAAMDTDVKRKLCTVSRGSSLLGNEVRRWEKAKSGSRRVPQGPAPGSPAVGKEGGPECLGESGVLLRRKSFFAEVGIFFGFGLSCD